MERLCWSSLAAVLCLGAVGCRPAASGGPPSLLVYCTFSGEPQARVLKRALEAHGDWKAVLAPLGGPDMLAAIEGTKAGDFAVFPEAALQQELAARRLLRGEPLRYDLRFYAIAKAPFALADLGAPGRRLGSFRADSLLSKSLMQALPEDLRAPVESNIRQRSERAEELERLVRLGALDAAFVWATPPAGTDLQVVPVGGDMACCPLLVASLACSRLTETQAAAVLEVWKSPEVARALQERPAGRKAAAP